MLMLNHKVFLREIKHHALMWKLQTATSAGRCPLSCHLALGSRGSTVTVMSGSSCPRSSPPSFSDGIPLHAEACALTGRRPRPAPAPPARPGPSPRWAAGVCGTSRPGTGGACDPRSVWAGLLSPWRTPWWIRWTSPGCAPAGCSARRSDRGPGVASPR